MVTEKEVFMVQIKCVNIDVFLPQGKTEHKCAEIRHKKGRENNFIPLPFFVRIFIKYCLLIWYLKINIIY